MDDVLTKGLVLGPSGPATRYVDDAIHAAALGFDVVELPDHLGMVAPLPTLAAIATAEPRIRVTNHVLNASFYRPHLLARDIAAVHQLSGGRFITSLGTGYAASEFETAGIPFLTAGQRVRAVHDTAVAIRDIWADPDYVAPSELSPPLTRIAGRGDRLLEMAARVADMVLIDPVVTETVLAERIEFVRSKAGDRVDDVTFCFPFMQLTLDGSPDLNRLRQLKPDLDDDELRALPTVLAGTIDEISAKIRRVRQLGVTYLNFVRTPSTSWDALEQLMPALQNS